MRFLNIFHMKLMPNMTCDMQIEIESSSEIF